MNRREPLLWYRWRKSELIENELAFAWCQRGQQCRGVRYIFHAYLQTEHIDGGDAAKVPPEPNSPPARINRWVRNYRKIAIGSIQTAGP